MINISAPGTNDGTSMVAVTTATKTAVFGLKSILSLESQKGEKPKHKTVYGFVSNTKFEPTA